MAQTKSLHEIKQAKFRTSNPNTISDSDYRLRDKADEASRGYPNSIDMTPVVAKKADKASAKES